MDQTGDVTAGPHDDDVRCAPETGRLVSFQTHGLNLSFSDQVPGAYPGTPIDHIREITDNYNPAKSRQYEYDRWYRLTGYRVSNQRTVTYSYRTASGRHLARLVLRQPTVGTGLAK